MQANTAGVALLLVIDIILKKITIDDRDGLVVRPFDQKSESLRINSWQGRRLNEEGRRQFRRKGINPEINGVDSAK